MALADEEPVANYDRSGRPPSEDVLDLGPDRRSGLLQQRWQDRFARVPGVTRWTVALTVGALTVLGYFVLRSAPHHSPADVGAAAATGPHFADDQAVDMVAATARQQGRLHDFIRSTSAAGSCAMVPVGEMPQGKLEAAVRKALPAYAMRDVARTLDQFTGLCSLELRASSPSGSTLVAKIASPPRTAAKNLFDQTTVASRTDGSIVVTMVSNVTRAGWTITFGAVGPVSDQPSSAVLLELAQDPTLPW